MAFDEGLAERLRDALAGNESVVEKKMFGGLAFMVRGNMCVGIVKDMLMARVGPLQYEECLSLPGAKEMDFTGKAMKGMVYVDAQTIEDDKKLELWVEYCHKFIASLPSK